MVAQKITIEPVTRIEGHAKVTIHLNDQGKVEHAYMHVNEFRGFEKFCEGRMAFEMPYITPASAAFARSVITWQLPRQRTQFLAALHPILPICCANSCTWVRSSKAMECIF